MALKGPVGIHRALRVFYREILGESGAHVLPIPIHAFPLKLTVRDTGNIMDLPSLRKRVPFVTMASRG